jgi:drug/metabolite transporter (DMT)-like permease
MLRILIAVAIATLSGALGQILTRRGMQIVGPLESYAVLDMLAYFWRALIQPYVIAGTVLSAVFYFALLAALGWTDVTVAFPLTALEYGFGALLAVLILKERVSALRWLGIVIIIIGVIIVSLTTSGESATNARPDAARVQQPDNHQDS